VDEIGALLRDMEDARKAIVSFVMDQGKEGFDTATVTPSERDSYFGRRKAAYMRDISPSIVGLITRCLVLFGPDPVVVALQQIALGAEVNDPARLMLANQLAAARTALSLR
jgi:hypothetical protein